MCQNAMGHSLVRGAAWTAAVGYGGAEGSHPPDSCNRGFPPVYRASHNCKPLEGRPMRRLLVSVVAVMAVAGCQDARDRKSTRLNSSHGYISYAVFCLKKKKK